MKLPIYLLFAILPAAVFASPFTMISAGDPALDDLRFVARESGRSFTSLTPPLSPDEVLLILEGVDTAVLSRAGLSAYSRVMERLNPKPQITVKDDVFSFEGHVYAALEGRVRSNDAVSWSQPDKDSPAMLFLPLNFYFADRLQLNMEPSILKQPSYYADAGSYFGSNMITAPEQFDLNMPLRAFVAAGGAWWNFELGRDRFSFGTANTGNLAISDTPDYYDAARLSLFSRNFKYSMLVVHSPLEATLEAGGLIAPDAPNKPGDGTDGSDTDAVPDFSGTTQRYMYIHRIDARLFNRVTLSITDGLMVGASPLELRFLNPLSIFHSFFAWLDYPYWDRSQYRSSVVGSLFAVDVDWAITRNTALYGQFVMNELGTPYEVEHYSEFVSPNAMGFLAGFEMTLAVSSWAARFFIEGVYGDPYLYTLSSPFCSYIWMRSSSDLENGKRYSFFGHPAGRDMITAVIGTNWKQGDLSLSGRLSYTARGEHTVRWDWAMGKGYNDQRTPSGTPQHEIAAVVGAKWKPLSFLALSGEFGASALFNAGHIVNEREFGVNLILSAAVFY